MDEQALGERLDNWSKNFTSFGRLFGGAVTGGVEILEGTLGTNVYGEKLDTVDRILSVASGAGSIGVNVGLAGIKPSAVKEIKTGQAVDFHEFNRLNEKDIHAGKIKPAEASAAVEIQNSLGGTLKRIDNLDSSADFIFTSGPNKGKTVDFMFTTGGGTVKEINGINQFFDKN